MESSYLILFSSVAVAIALLSALAHVVFWARLTHVDERQEALSREVLKESTPKKLEQAIATSESSRDRIDTALLELLKFKDQVHAEMQRFYAIMRRSEKTAGFEKATTSAESESAPPDEISVDALKKPEPDERESKADLRKRARAAGL